MLEGNYARVKFGYTGHRLEERTGHWSAMYRQLDPRAGRWTQRDPLGALDGHNRYSYVRAAPVSMVDPTGLFAVKGSVPQWLWTALNELKADVSRPRKSLCVKYAGCTVCPSCEYTELMSAPITLDFSRPGSGGEYAQVEPGNIIRIDGSLVQLGKDRFKEVLLHELTHICTLANVKRDGRVGPWQEPFRWMLFVRGDTSNDVRTWWKGKSACDRCPDPPVVIEDMDGGF